MSNRCLIVLGMHRSGTSALTGVLAKLGAFTGNDLIPADEGTNPKGFWESAEVVAFHEALFGHLGSSWDDGRSLPDEWWEQPSVVPFRERLVELLRRDYGAQPLWIVKDPRLCRLLPLWMAVLEEVNCEPAFVLCTRHPGEVAASLHRRNGLEESEVCLLWLSHMLEAERYSRGYPRTLISYGSLLLDWRPAVRAIFEDLSLDGWPVSEASARELDGFLEPGLRHHAADIVPPESPVCELAQEAHKLFETIGLADTAAIDRLSDRMELQRRDADLWIDEFRRLRAQVAPAQRASQEEIRMLSDEIARIRRTVSWQITKPLRLLFNLPRLIREHSNR